MISFILFIRKVRMYIKQLYALFNFIITRHAITVRLARAT